MIISLEMSPENMRDRIYTMLGSGLFKASDIRQQMKLLLKVLQLEMAL